MAISSDSIYSETLQSIIDAKLEELVKKRNAFEASKAAVQKTFAAETDEAERVRILKDGIKTCFRLKGMASNGVMQPTSANSDLAQLLRNLDKFLEQPRYDPSVSSYQLQTWAATLGHHFDIQSRRYQFASVYAKLVTEWLEFEKKLVKPKADADTQMAESFEELDNPAKLESRRLWEQNVFQSPNVDTKAIKALLQSIYGERNGNKQLSKAIATLRNSVTKFEASMSAPGQFNSTTLRWSINGLLASDLLSQENRTVLKDFLNNQIILSEIADVLNLRMARVENWTWGAPVPMEQQKRLAGQYSIFMQEDLLQAVFIQYIGVKWSVFLKDALRKFVRTQGAWLSSRQVVSKDDHRRREYYLGRQEKQPSVHSKRNNLWLNRYFMTQLLSTEEQGVEAGDGEQEADFGFYTSPPPRQQSQARMQQMQMPVQQAPGQGVRRQMASQAARKSAPSTMGAKRHRRMAPDKPDDENSDFPDDDDDDDNGGTHNAQNLMTLKQGLLHILRTETLINTHFHGEITGVRAQFANWNSLLPHETILAVAEYLGISKSWLAFFKSFMRAPLSFVADGVSEEARTRLRGVPGSHPLSDVLGEMVLFSLDLHINHSTGGHKLWRVHDDLWFWSVDHEVTVKAWAGITKFSQTMGLSLDTKKAGSVRVTRDKKAPVQLDASLPPNKIRWGFLYLDSQTGEWEIDQSIVDVHISELGRQLDGKSGSVLSWIQAWNAYANTFFTSNFGKPANCFGRAHIEKALATLERVQRKLFEEQASNNVVEYLKDTISRRFDVSDVPEGYCFFPTELGGLELRNPFISLLLVYDAIDKRSNPDVILKDFEKDERNNYESDKRTFDKGKVGRYDVEDPDWVPEGSDRDTFMSFDEFVKYREEYSYGFNGELADVWKEFLEECKPQDVVPTSDIMTAMNLMDKSGVIGQSSSINGNWHGMNSYWKWVTQMYGEELVKRFGGFNIVDNGVLPIGMVSLFRSDRVQWKA